MSFRIVNEAYWSIIEDFRVRLQILVSLASSLYRLQAHRLERVCRDKYGLLWPRCQWRIKTILWHRRQEIADFVTDDSPNSTVTELRRTINLQVSNTKQLKIYYYFYRVLYSSEYSAHFFNLTILLVLYSVICEVTRLLSPVFMRPTVCKAGMLIFYHSVTLTDMQPKGDSIYFRLHCKSLITSIQSAAY